MSKKVMGPHGREAVVVEDLSYAFHTHLLGKKCSLNTGKGVRWQLTYK